MVHLGITKNKNVALLASFQLNWMKMLTKGYNIVDIFKTWDGIFYWFWLQLKIFVTATFCNEGISIWIEFLIVFEKRLNSIFWLGIFFFFSNETQIIITLTRFLFFNFFFLVSTFSCVFMISSFKTPPCPLKK